MLSHQHLAADAEERRILIMTYLSLRRRGKLPDEANLDLLLGPLFRPGTDGLVKEDVGPVHPLWELMKNRGK